MLALIQPFVINITMFDQTGPMCPEKHLEASALLGHDVGNAKKEDAGRIVADVLRSFMDKMKIPNGLTSLGYTKDDIPMLVKGALPQVSMRNVSINDFSK